PLAPQCPGGAVVVIEVGHGFKSFHLVIRPRPITCLGLTGRPGHGHGYVYRWAIAECAVWRWLPALTTWRWAAPMATTAAATRLSGLSSVPLSALRTPSPSGRSRC